MNDLLFNSAIVNDYFMVSAKLAFMRLTC